MQVSEIKDSKTNNNLYLRARVDENQQKIIDTLGLKAPNDTTPHSVINQIFTK